MSEDACATPGCGHPKVSHGTEGCAARRGGRQLAKERACTCTAYLPPRPVPEDDHGNRGWEATATGWRCTECHHEVVGPIDVTIDAAHRCASVPTPHAEAEVAAKRLIDQAVYTAGDTAGMKKAIKDGEVVIEALRGRGDRG